MNRRKDQFFGRERVLREITEGVLATQPASFSLVGAKLAGKSRLLDYLASPEGPLLSDEYADLAALRLSRRQPGRRDGDRLSLAGV